MEGVGSTVGSTVGSAVRTAGNWLFRDRSTGRLVVAQRPNLPLLTWFACAVIGRLAHPSRPWARALDVVGTGALVLWAGDEVLRGVNPWRRALGAAVLVALLIGWLVGR